MMERSVRSWGLACFLLLLIALMAPACRTVPSGTIPSLAFALKEPNPYFASLPAETDTEADEKEEGSTLGTILLYLPNRVFDLLELVRVGVNAGIGVGVDCRATWLAQAVAIQDSSVGIGFQGLRHLPVCARLGHTAVGVGPIKTPSLGLFDWPINDYDLRVELFVLVVGVHAAVDFGALGDFLAGLLTFDPSEDDFVLGG